MASQKRRVRNAWPQQHCADGATQTTHIEFAFDAVGTPRFPSFLLTLEQARSFHEALANRLLRVGAINGEVRA